MSNTIDQRVVEMKFDNQNFERNVSTTMSTLDKLKQSLKLSGASKGFENISTAANGVNMSGLGSAVETVQAKFSALSVIGVTALANITNSAINTGKQLIKSLSIDQVTAGWDKFASKTTSVATLVAQGNELETVNEQLDRLNWFTDETSYNFTDMVSNIAKFTATGKGLDESVVAMEGIANWAALSGQNAATASRAMYQLSQAMGAGVMRKEDYKSIQNASMDTDEFRRKCLEAGVALGTLKDNGDGTYQSLVEGAKSSAFTQSQFADHLTQDMWFTSDVMMKVFTDYSSAVNAIYEVTEEKGMLASEVLDQVHTRADELKTDTMSDEEAINAAIKDLGYTAADGSLLFDAFGIKAFEAAQKARTWGDAVDSVKDAVSTGWMNTFEIIFGNAEEATKLWTDLANAMYDVFAGGAETRNEMLKGWKELGGRDDMLEGFWNMWEGFFGDGDKYIGILGAIKEAFSEVFPPMTSERLASITEGFKNLTEKLKPSVETLDKLKRAFKGVFSIFDMGKKIVSAILKPIGQLFGSEGFGSLGDFLLTTAANIGDFFTALNEDFETTKFSDVLSKITSGVSDFLKGLFDGLGGFSGIFSSVGDTICSVASKIWGAVTKVFGWIKENISAGDIFAGLAGGGIFVAAKKFSGLINKIKDTLDGLFNKEKGDGIKSKFADILDSVHDSLESFTSGIKVASLVGIAAAVGILSASLNSIAKLDVADVGKGLSAIGAMLIELSLSFRSINKTLSKFNAKGLIKAGAAMILLATAVRIMSGALVKLSELSLKEIGKGLIALGGALAELCIGLKLINGVKIPLRTSIAMLALAESCKILGNAFEKFSAFSWDEIARGLIAMGGALGELVAAMAVLQKFSGFKSLFGSLGILITVQSLKKMAEGLKSFAEMSWDEIKRGLVGMGSALAEVGGVTAAVGKISGFSNILGAGGILITVQSLSKLADAFNSFAGMSWGEIGRGLAGMGGALAEVGGVTGALGKIAGFSSIFGSGAILITIQGLADLASAFKSFGGMSWDEILKGLTGMGGALAEVTLMSGALGTFAGFAGILGSGAILIAVQGLADLASAFKSFGGMSWDEINRGVAGMGSALAEVTLMSGALGTFAGFAGILGSASILIVVQGLDDLANALKKFGEMNWGEIGRGLTAMGIALGEVGLGALLNTFSGIGAHVISTIAEPLGALADSVKKWSDVNVPIGLGAQLGILAAGVGSFTFDGLGALAINGVAEPLGTLADSVKKWSGVTVPDGIGTQLARLAAGVLAFTYDGLGALAIMGVAEPLGVMADSVKKWDGVTVPDGLGDNLSELAKGVRSFTFDGLGASALATSAPGIGDMATSIKKWNGVSIPDGLGDNLAELAKGVRSFTFAFAGGWSIGETVEPLKNLASSVKAWNGVSVPSGLSDDLTSLANGVKAFSFAFFGGWSIGSILDPLKNLASSVRAWNGVSIPTGLDVDLSSLASGVKSFSFAFVGGWSMGEAVEPLKNLASSIKAWNGVTVPSGLDTDLTSLAKGVRAFTLDGFGADALSTVAPSIGIMANSIKKWSGVTVPEGLGDQLKSLAKGVGAFTFDGFGASALSTVAPSVGVMADSIKKWSGVTVPDGLGDQLKSLAKGVKAFNFDGGNNSLATSAPAIGTMASSIKKWSNVTVPEGMQEKLESLAKGVKAFNFEGAGDNALASSATGISAIAEAIKSWSGVSIPEGLGDQLKSLGRGVKAFSFESAGENTLATSAAGVGSMADSIKKWANVTIPEGLGTQLENLAKGVEAFSFDGENSLATSATGVGSMADSIKKWAGVTIPEGLGEQLKSLAKGVEAFGFDGENSLATSATGVGSMADSIKKWTGVTIPEGMEENLTSLARGVKAFSSDGFGDGGLASSATGISSMADAIRNWSGVSIPSGLDSDLKSLADGVKAFDGISGASAGVAALQNIYSAASRLSGINFESIGSGLDKLANSIKSFGSIGSSISGVGEAITTNLVTPIQNAIPVMTNAGVEISNAIVTGITSRQSAITSAVNTATNAAVRAARAKTGAFKSAGSSLGNALASGIRSCSSSTSSAGSSIGNSAASGARGAYSSMYSAGSYLCDGLAAGIKNNAYKAVNAAKKMAQDVADAAKSALEINSPSKVFMRIAASIPEGLAMGIDKNVDMAEMSAVSMADGTVQTVQKAISRIGDLVNTDIDAQPTIKPVVDLSDVKAGANAISGMFDSGPSVGVMANIKAISSSMDRRSQNGVNDDVVSAINKLRDKLDNVGSTSYTINGVTYDDGSAVSDAIETLVRYAKIEGRV